MRQHGRYVPEQDAAWEAAGQFRDLDETPARVCHAKICFYDRPEGRFFHKEDGLWEKVQCSACGSRGIHIKCGGLEVTGYVILIFIAARILIIDDHLLSLLIMTYHY